MAGDKMNCRDCQNQLIEYLDETLLKGEAEAVQSHLSRCQACQKEEKVLLALLSGARAPLPEPSDLFWTNFLPRVRERISSRPEPWHRLLFKPAVGWGSLSLAALTVLAGLMFWRMAPTWQAGTPKTSQGDYLSYETGYTLDEHLAQVVETSKDKTEARHKVFEKLSPQQDQGEDTQVVQSLGENLDNLVEGLSPAQKKALDERIKELEGKNKGQGGVT